MGTESISVCGGCTSVMDVHWNEMRWELLFAADFVIKTETMARAYRRGDSK